MKKMLVLALGAALLASGCVNKAQTGGVGGAAVGAIMGQAIGHNTAGTLLGAAIGGTLGYMVGNEMDKEDQARLSNAYEYTPDHSTSRWVNPNTGNAYQVTPQRTWREPETNLDCREVEINATIDGRQEKTYSTACRENGRWVMR